MENEWATQRLGPFGVFLSDVGVLPVYGEVTTPPGLLSSLKEAVNVSLHLGRHLKAHFTSADQLNRPPRLLWLRCIGERRGLGGIFLDTLPHRPANFAPHPPLPDKIP